MTEYPLGASGKQEAMLLSERVGEAQREAIKEVKESQMTQGHSGRGKKRSRGEEDERDRDDDEREAGVPMRKGGGGRGGRGGRGGGRGQSSLLLSPVVSPSPFFRSLALTREYHI